MSDYIAPIQVPPMELGFSEEVHSDGSRVVFVMNHWTGEIREQVVARIPTNPKWRQTVERRMRRTPRDEQVPIVLLRGVK
jgi:hypothetical protein